MSAAAKPKATDRLIKVSAEGLPLPRNATEWSGVYIPAAELTVARRPMPAALGFKAANAACAKFDLCGAKAERSIGLREFVNHVLEFDRIGPALDPEFFTIDDPWKWIWTRDECAPASFSFVVDLYDGRVSRYRHDYPYRALAVRAGQLSAFSKTARRSSSGRQ